jgi:hypothetical protein
VALLRCESLITARVAVFLWAKHMSDLADELATDPLSRGYSGMTDAAASASLNAVDRPGRVKALEVKRYLQLTGEWAAIAEDANTHPTRGTKLSCRAIVDALADFETFDLQDAQIRGVITAALEALQVTGGTGHLDDAQTAEILALENNRQTRAQELGLGVVHVGDVEYARSL